MLTVRTLVLLLFTGLLISGCAAPQSIDAPAAAPRFTLDELLGRLPARDSLEARWVFSAIVDMGPSGIREICARLSKPGTPAAAHAEYALQGIAAYVTRPNREAERTMFVTTLGRVLEQPLSPEHASAVIRFLQVAGKAESVPTLTRFLSDDRLCEPATQALVAIRTNASQPLYAALAQATGQSRITLIEALGVLRAREAVPALLKDAASSDVHIRTAALTALANIGDASAEQVLANAAATDTSLHRAELINAYLQFARRRLEAVDGTTAIRVGQQLLKDRRDPEGGATRAAALTLLVDCQRTGALDNLMSALEDPDKSLRVAALRLASGLVGDQVTARLTEAMKSSSPALRSELIGALALRGDKKALPAIHEAISDPDSTVRVAAIDAAVRLGGGESVPALLKLLSTSQAPGDIAAIKRTLASLPASQVMSPLVEALPRLTPPACTAMLDMLSNYGGQAPSAPVFALTRSENANIRLSAIKALGAIASPDDQPELLAALLSAKTEGEQSAVQRSLASVCGKIANPDARADRILTAVGPASKNDRGVLLRVLGRIGGSKAMTVILQDSKSTDADVRDAAVRALADWPTLDAFEPLLAIARSKEKLNLRVLALRGCVRIVENAPLNAATAVRYHERTLAAAERPEEKRLVLGALGNLSRAEALKLVIPYIGDDTLGVDAAAAAGKIASLLMPRKSDDNDQEDVVSRAFVESRVPAALRAQVATAFDRKVRKNDPPEGFKTLFNGRDLAGWKGLVENPIVRASMDPQKLAAAQARADSSMRAHWSVVDGTLVFDGKGESLCTVKDFEDFEMLVDWKIEKDGDSGIYLRGSPQVQIWDPAKWPEGSGGLYNNQKGPSKPLLRADNAIGEWNTFRIRMVGERVTVYLNDVLVVDSVALENYWDRSLPIFPRGQIELQSHSTPLFFRNIYIREIPRKRQTFAGNLFNGRDLTGWQVIGGKESAWGISDGILFTTGEGGGWLSTMQEFGDFQLDLDFRVVAGGNSGVFIRAPRQGDPAYTGMEIQVLDDDAPEYANLKPWQYCGSVYGVQPPAVRATKKANEWQHMQIIADGPRVKVSLNNQQIVDADLVAHMDKEAAHPGLKRRAGFIGLQSHSSRVEFRNIIINELR